MDFFKELAVFIEGEVRIEADLLGQSAIQRFSLASGWAGDRFGLYISGFPASLQPALNGGHRNPENFGDSFAGHPSIDGCEHLHPQILGVWLHAPSFAQRSILEKTSVEHYEPDIVVHAAAYTDVRGTEAEKGLCWRVNTVGTRNVVGALAGSAAKLVHISTDHVVFWGDKGPRLRRGPLPSLARGREKILGYEGDFYCSDIGTLEAYRTAQRDALSGKVRLKIPGGRRSEELWADDRRTRLHPTVSLQGRLVGRGATLFGSKWWVRAGATIKRTILLPGLSIEEGAPLEDHIVGDGHDVWAGERM